MNRITQQALCSPVYAANGERLDVEQKHTTAAAAIACTIQRLRQTLRRRRDGSAKIGGIARTTT